MMHAKDSFIATNMCSSNEKCRGFVQERKQQPSSLSAASTLLSDSTFQAIVDVQGWIHTEGRCCRNIPSMIRSLALQMRIRGIPVDRIYLGTTVIHPQATAFCWKWESTGREWEWTFNKDAFAKLRRDTRDAPLNQLEFQDAIRIKATDAYIPSESRSIFETEGHVDMYGLPYFLRGEYGGGITWATKRACGFTERDIAFFNTIMPALSMLIQLLLNDLCMNSILKTYLGKDAGTRVYNGSIERGDCITVRSVVWFSDIRGFSKLSAELERDEVIALVNDVFQITEDVLNKKGGEVLKFLGDGIMGVFTINDNEAQVCQRAREASEEVQERLKELRVNNKARGVPSAEMGIGLHYGDASYGNIGSPTRLDFTLIGQCVNVASRIEGLCSELNLSVLASADFVEVDSRREDAWSTCGKHQIKGFEEPVEVFELSNSARTR